MNDQTECLSRTALLVQLELYPGLSEDAIVDGLTTSRVRLRADAPNLATAAGQTALISAAICSAQTGARVVLDAPDVKTAGPQPPLEDGRLTGGLADVLSDLIVLPTTEDLGYVDVTVLLGDTPASPQDSGLVLRLSGSAWQFVLEEASTSSGRRWSNELPIGAALGGAAIAAETFRVSMRALAHCHGVKPQDEHLIRRFEPVEVTLPQIVVPRGRLAAGAMDIVSAGAITNAMLFALLRVQKLTGKARVFDADVGELSNLNRYPLLRRRLLNRPKVDVLASFGSGGIEIEAHAMRVDEETARDNPFAPIVLVGVDDIPSRWVAQRHASEWLAVGGTSRFETVVSGHQPGEACAGCLHPYGDPNDGPVPTVSFVSAWAGIMLAYRLLARLCGTPLAPATLGWPLNLASRWSVMDIPCPPRRECPVRCEAAQALDAPT